MVKGGVYKTTLLDKNDSLKWTISGDAFLGINNVNRRFLVVDNVLLLFIRGRSKKRNRKRDKTD